MCFFSVCAQQVKVFPDLGRELFVCIFKLVTLVHELEIEHRTWHSNKIEDNSFGNLSKSSFFPLD